MNISISGQNIDTGAAFQQHSREVITEMIEKYYAPAISAHVTLEKQDSQFQVRMRINLTNRIELESTGSARDAHAALEAAAGHAEKRLRRHKRRLKNHRQNGADKGDIFAAPMSIYAGAEHEQTLQKTSAQTSASEEDAGDEDMGEEALPVIAELSYEIESLTVEQAVMRLELSGDTCLLFRNSGHLGLNMVHLRNDGTIGWVDPRGTRQMADSI